MEYIDGGLYMQSMTHYSPLSKNPYITPLLFSLFLLILYFLGSMLSLGVYDLILGLHGINIHSYQNRKEREKEEHTMAMIRPSEGS